MMLSYTKKAVLVLGSDGMAGSMVSMYLKEKNHIVYATSRRKNNNNQLYFNLTQDNCNVEKIIEQCKPDYIINCLGLLNKQAEEYKADAALINSYFPHHVDALSEKYGFKFIHISTDCVFSGQKGNYIESDLPDAESFYGRSKALGEITNSQSLTFRTSIIGPDVNSKSIGLFNWFMDQTTIVSGYDKVIWSGITTLELAKSIEKSFSMNISGLFHLVNNSSIDKHQLLLLFKKYMNKEIKVIKNSDHQNNKSLRNTRKDANFNIPNYPKMIEEMSSWINDHRQYYSTITSY